MTRKDVLDAASACVNGDRDKRYGNPEDSFRLIAHFWNDYMRNAAKTYDPMVHSGIISASDVAAMLALVKIARIAGGKRHPDNWIDLAGYAACGGEIETGGSTASEV